MSKKQDDRDPATDVPTEAPVVPAEKFSSEDRLANAIASLNKANQGASPPSHGPHPTDPEGKKLKPDAVFVDRDGKEYEAIIDGAYLSDRAETKGNQDAISGNSASYFHAIAFNVRVNFKAKKSDNWKPVFGVYRAKDLRNTHRKQIVRLSTEADAHYVLKLSSDGKKVLGLPEGVSTRTASK